MAQVFDNTKHLTPEEMLVLQVFQGSLGPRWEISVHPYLNGLCPHFVLLHPEVGIGVYEVEEKLPTTSSTAALRLCHEVRAQLCTESLAASGWILSASWPDDASNDLDFLERLEDLDRSRICSWEATP